MNEIDYNAIWQQLKSLFFHEVNYAKLTAVEKITVLLSAAVFVAVIIFLAACLLFCLSFALIFWLSDILGNTWIACLIAASILIILMLVIVATKKRFIVNPVSRFVTKLFLNNPDEQ